MLRPDRTLEVVLPFGLPDGRDRRARGATLIPCNGEAELLGADEPNPFLAALRLLAASLDRLGRLRAGDIDLAVLGSLLPVDRDWLLVQLAQMTFGEVRYQTVCCPSEGCGKRIDVRVDLSTLSPPEAPPVATGRLELPDGSELEYRLPSAGDQVALFGVPSSELESAFLERCIRACGQRQLGAGVSGLSTDVTAAIVREILDASPELDTTLDLECIECKTPFRFVYEPVHALLGELRASRAALLKEVHYLALHYHWSQAEILSLPRTLRHEYLGLLEAELEQRQRGLA